MKTTLGKIGFLLVTAAFLSGCVLFDATRRGPGPDEFGVVSRAPLTQPPDYALRPPREGARRPNEAPPQQEARERLLSASAGPGLALGGQGTNAIGAQVPEESLSPGETAFLKHAGALNVDDEIRVLVDRESGRVREDDSLVNRLVFWRTDDSVPGGVIDPAREAERLSRNAALGESPTTGQTPVIPR